MSLKKVNSIEYVLDDFCTGIEIVFEYIIRCVRRKKLRFKRLYKLFIQIIKTIIRNAQRGDLFVLLTFYNRCGDVVEEIVDDKFINDNYDLNVSGLAYYNSKGLIYLKNFNV